MSTHDTNDLGSRLVALAPPIDLPVDLIDGVRRRARRRVAARLSGASAGVAVLVVGVLVAVHSLVGPAGPSDAQLRTLVAAGDAPPKLYTGRVVLEPDLEGKNLWVVVARNISGWQRVIVTYTKDGQPCVGDFDWHDSTNPAETAVSGGGGCSLSGTLVGGLMSSYGPNGPASVVGPEALLYGVVPANVRVVRADVRKGRLAEHFVATIATPIDPTARVFVFTSPGGTNEPLDAELTFFAADGTRLGSRHVDHEVDPGEDFGCPPASPGSACAEVSATAVPVPT
ncbi:MAG: hypothetical protein QOC82_15 [Frankiaceae bacterium]|jgi:hypothetical protein|nr:hypothetical protein [Frankiaceae bacterium]